VRRSARELGARALRDARGQASVELVALLPLVLLIGLVGFCVLAARAVSEQAGEAAGAGALALLQGRQPAAAARQALPQGADARVSVSGSRVAVRLRPRLPLGLGDLLAAEADADAGPEGR